MYICRSNDFSVLEFPDAFDTNKLDAMDKDALSQLQDFNKHYMNNDEASETGTARGRAQLHLTPALTRPQRGFTGVMGALQERKFVWSASYWTN